LGGRGSGSVLRVFLKSAKGTIPRRRTGKEHESGGRGAGSVLRVFLNGLMSRIEQGSRWIGS